MSDFHYTVDIFHQNDHVLAYHASSYYERGLNICFRSIPCTNLPFFSRFICISTFLSQLHLRRKGSLVLISVHKIPVLPSATYFRTWGVGRCKYLYNIKSCQQYSSIKERQVVIMNESGKGINVKSISEYVISNNYGAVTR